MEFAVTRAIVMSRLLRVLTKKSRNDKMAALKAGTGGLRGSVPRPAYVLRFQPSLYAGMMELADMQDLGSCAAMRWGSNPHARTKSKRKAVGTGDWAFRCPLLFCSGLF